MSESIKYDHLAILSGLESQGKNQCFPRAGACRWAGQAPALPVVEVPMS